MLAATEAGCPNVVSDLLARGAKMDYKNDMGESPFHIAARLPKTRKDEFEELLKDVRRNKENKPKESIADILREAEKVSRDLANVFLSQSLEKHDPISISNQMFDMMNFVKKEHFDANALGDEQKVYLKYDKTNQNETLLESTLNIGMVKEREDMIRVMKIVDLQSYPNQQEDADKRIKRQVKKAVPSSVGLRDCIKSVSENFPWTSSKLKFMTSLSFFIQVILGTTFYGFDVYTDIKFSIEMLENSKKSFGAEMTKCLYKFDGKFDQTIEDCKMQFNKQACMESLAEVKRTSDECVNNEQRFSDTTDCRID